MHQLETCLDFQLLNTDVSRHIREEGYKLAKSLEIRVVEWAQEGHHHHFLIVGIR